MSTNILDQFKAYTATVVGQDHQMFLSNGHDGCMIAKLDKAIVGLVCDGCGSQPHSEVGAKLGAHFVVKSINSVRQNMGGNPNIFESYFWESVQSGVVSKLIDVTQKMMFGPYEYNLATHFLFTCMGFIITEERTVVFHVGDGIYVVNGQPFVVEPLEGNRPIYIAYNLLDIEVEIPDHKLGFEIHKYNTEDIQTLLVATDGFSEVIKAAGKPFPGEEELIPEAKEMWEKDKYFANPSLANRKLRMMNTTQYRMRGPHDNRRLMKYQGYLHDDVTIVAAKRFIPSPSGVAEKSP